MTQETLFPTEADPEPPTAEPIMIRFEVVGRAYSAGSKRGMAIMKGPAGARVPVIKAGRPLVSIVDDNPKQREWMAAVAQVARKAYHGPLLTGAIAVSFWFDRVRPKSHYRTGRYAGELRADAPAHPTGVPDSLKLGRAVEDALTGVLWRDDAQVVNHQIVKRWGQYARCVVEVVSLDGLTEVEVPF